MSTATFAKSAGTRLAERSRRSPSPGMALARAPAPARPGGRTVCDPGKRGALPVAEAFPGTTRAAHRSERLRSAGPPRRSDRGGAGQCSRWGAGRPALGCGRGSRAGRRKSSPSSIRTGVARPPYAKHARGRCRPDQGRAGAAGPKAEDVRAQEMLIRRYQAELQAAEKGSRSIVAAAEESGVLPPGIRRPEFEV